MALFQSKQIIAGIPVPSELFAGNEVNIISEFVVPATLALNDVIEMCGIPEGAIITAVKMFAEPVDSNAAKTLALDIGFISGTYGKRDPTRTCDNSFAAADTTARAGGVFSSTSSAGFMQAPKTDGGTPPGNVTAGFGFKVSAAAATLVAGARIRLFVNVMPPIYGIN